MTRWRGTGLRRGTAALALVLAASGCGVDSLRPQAEECPEGTACALPPPPDPEPAGLPRLPAPDGRSTVPLRIALAEVDGDRLAVRIEYADLCQDLLGVHVREADDVVTVIAVGTPMGDPCLLRARLVRGTVVLDRALGDRTVALRTPAP
ncbi:MAG TPA: hypothetical protein VM433_02225 [Mycobacteriales bacterium]|nr:hypothetical protein [Mycobacteriales bacterium]